VSPEPTKKRTARRPVLVEVAGKEEEIDSSDLERDNTQTVTLNENITEPDAGP